MRGSLASPSWRSVIRTRSRSTRSGYFFHPKAFRSIEWAAIAASSVSITVVAPPSWASATTARALRRLLTMTGALRWDEVLSAWARAGGKPPYSPLPADVATMKAWSQEAGGFKVSPIGRSGGPASIDVVASEELDHVSQF